jgi:hypothetical protein
MACRSIKEKMRLTRPKVYVAPHIPHERNRVPGEYIVMFHPGHTINKHFLHSSVLNSKSLQLLKMGTAPTWTTSSSMLLDMILAWHS